MTRGIILLPEALDDIKEAKRWYEARTAGLGQELLRAIDAALHAIARRPEQYPVIFKDARRVLLRKFPYALIFQVEDDVVVVACSHTRRDPDLWRARL